MSILTDKDLHFPLSSTTLRKLKGHLLERIASQAVAATANVLFTHNGQVVTTQDGNLDDVYILSPVAAAAGESMVADVQKSTDGGATFTSVLTGTKTFSSTSPVKEQISLVDLIDPAKKYIRAGTILRLVLVYTAGGGPTPIAYFTAGVEIG